MRVGHLWTGFDTCVQFRYSCEYIADKWYLSIVHFFQVRKTYQSLMSVSSFLFPESKKSLIRVVASWLTWARGLRRIYHRSTPLPYIYLPIYVIVDPILDHFSSLVGKNLIDWTQTPSMSSRKLLRSTLITTSTFTFPALTARRAGVWWWQRRTL